MPEVKPKALEKARLPHGETGRFGKTLGVSPAAFAAPNPL